MIQYTTWGQNILFNFHILVLTPFRDLKRYFSDFLQFYTQILTKKLKITKTSKTIRFLKKVQIIQYTTWGERILFNFQILFLTPFCDLKQYFSKFLPFYTQSLPKHLKLQKHPKL